MKKNYNSPKIKVAKSTLNIKYMEDTFSVDMKGVYTGSSIRTKEIASQGVGETSGQTFW
ncbi:MAG: hypothetical protein MJZ20_10005 [Bacteroidaceae bacterium]|nr:hypothetical protein [Bacteroidaceae bacterium]MCQ2077334.1 hypothetical protein [Bacteroidaceae bacterium]